MITTACCHLNRLSREVWSVDGQYYFLFVDGHQREYYTIKVHRVRMGSQKFFICDVRYQNNKDTAII